MYCVTQFKYKSTPWCANIKLLEDLYRISQVKCADVSITMRRRYNSMLHTSAIVIASVVISVILTIMIAIIHVTIISAIVITMIVVA